MPYDITNLDVADILNCSEDVRRAAQGRPNVEASARALCDCLYEAFVGPRKDRACVLVRFYVTVPYGELPAAEQEFASRLLPEGVVPWPELRCLALLGTRGIEDAWNSRHGSRGHRAIPLPSVAVVEQAPMIAQLFQQMGASIADIVAPKPQMLAPEKRLFNVFHVPVAKGSGSIPAQAGFVERYGVESVVGFGGVLPWGELFSMILFSRAPISAQSAARFRTLALDVRASLRDYERAQLFDHSASAVDASSSAESAEDHFDQSRDGTSMRTFQDGRGVTWKVWAVVPSQTELDSLAAKFRAVSSNSAKWQKGWLLFESSSESRRLGPIPDQWESAALPELDAMCREAKPLRANG